MKPLRLSLTALDERAVPAAAQIGAVWANPAAVTVSFAPDDTDVAGAKSDLFASLAADGYATPAVWQTEALRALQTWAAATNLNFGLVADGGAALGTPGAVQGDARFGDIRLAARPMAEGTLAQTTPFTWTGSTWSGDIVLNSDVKFTTGKSTGYDLYSVVLHEVGHSLGFTTESDDPASVMYGEYVKRAGLGAVDVAAIQGMYGGARSEPVAGVTATTVVKLEADPTKAAGFGDVTKAGEVDTYTVKASGVNATSALVVTLQTAGISLFTGKVTVYDAAGKAVGSATAVDPFTGVATVTVLSPKKDATYTIKVQAAGAAFNVGGYQISAKVQDPTAPPPAVKTPAPKPVAGLGGNTTYAAAAGLKATVADADGKLTGYAVTSSLTVAGETDYYKVVSPDSTTNTTMLVRVLGLDDTVLAGRLSVFTGDAKNPKPVAFQVLVNANGLLSIQVQNTTPKTTYTIAVAAQAGSPAATGSYRLAVDYVVPQASTIQNFTGGTLTAAAPTQDGTLTLGDSRLVSFALAANGSATSRVRMTIRDAAGTEVFALTAAGGELPPTGEVFLTAGEYAVTYTAWDAVGGPASTASYSAFIDVLSDPIGMYLPYSTTTTTAPTSPPPAPSYPTRVNITYSALTFAQPLVSYPDYY